MAGVGLLMVLFSVVVSFFPPPSISGGDETHYVGILIVSFAVSMIIPHLIYAFRHREPVAEPRHAG